MNNLCSLCLFFMSLSQKRRQQKSQTGGKEPSSLGKAGWSSCGCGCERTAPCGQGSLRGRHLLRQAQAGGLPRCSLETNTQVLWREVCRPERQGPHRGSRGEHGFMLTPRQASTRAKQTRNRDPQGFYIWGLSDPKVWGMMAPNLDPALPQAFARGHLLPLLPVGWPHGLL